MNLLIAVAIAGYFISQLHSIRLEPWSLTIMFWPKSVASNKKRRDLHPSPSRRPNFDWRQC